VTLWIYVYHENSVVERGLLPYSINLISIWKNYRDLDDFIIWLKFFLSAALYNLRQHLLTESKCQAMGQIICSFPNILSFFLKQCGNCWSGFQTHKIFHIDVKKFLVASKMRLQYKKIFLNLVYYNRKWK